MEQIEAHLRKVIEKTERFRQCITPELLKGLAWGEKVSRWQIRSGVRILSLDNKLKDEWKKMLGKELAACSPFFPSSRRIIYKNEDRSKEFLDE